MPALDFEKLVLLPVKARVEESVVADERVRKAIEVAATKLTKADSVSPIGDNQHPRMLTMTAWMCHAYNPEMGRGSPNDNGVAFSEAELLACVQNGMFKAPYFGMVDYNHDFTAYGCWYDAQYAFDPETASFGILAKGAMFAWRYGDMADSMLAQQTRQGHLTFSMAAIPEFYQPDQMPEGSSFSWLRNPVFFTTSWLDVDPADHGAIGLGGEDPSITNEDRELELLRSALQAASLSDAEVGFKHGWANTKSPEPTWSDVAKGKLPRNAFADEGKADEESTWKYPHHWVSGSTMYVHLGGLNAAWAAANGARSGKKASPEVIAHLEHHRRALGLDKKTDKSALEDEMTDSEKAAAEAAAAKEAAEKAEKEAAEKAKKEAAEKEADEKKKDDEEKEKAKAEKEAAEKAEVEKLAAEEAAKKIVDLDSAKAAIVVMETRAKTAEVALEVLKAENEKLEAELATFRTEKEAEAAKKLVAEKAAVRTKRLAEIPETVKATLEQNATLLEKWMEQSDEEWEATKKVLSTTATVKRRVAATAAEGTLMSGTGGSGSKHAISRWKK